MPPRLVALAAIALAPPALDEFAYFHENVMGTALELRVRADSEPAARGAEARVLAEIDRLSAVLSNHDPASEFRRWQETRTPTRISRELVEVLSAADLWRVRTGGAFDPRAAALSRLWAGAAREGREPTAGAIASARALMEAPAWRISTAAGTAGRTSACPLTLDAIAKGWIVEHACEAAVDPALGVRGALLNVGGDLRAVGEFEATVGVAPPTDSEAAEPIAFAAIRDRSVATSGRAHRGFQVDGRRYSHILDPRTGRPVEGVAAATVIAERGADADALATSLNVLSIDEGLRLVDSLPDAACLIVADDGRVFRSASWARHQAPADPKPKGDEPKPEPSWGDDHELKVDFEINKPDAPAGRYRRPYVVVWVEDGEGKPVRNLLLWVSQGGSGPDRWLPDLRRWYRAEDAEAAVLNKNLAYTMGRPTRAPGKYSVTWDGKDDEGKPLPKGEYTVSIEAAREHGTHQLIRKKITVGGDPFAEELKGNVEIKSAAIAYRRKGQG